MKKVSLQIGAAALVLFLTGLVLILACRKTLVVTIENPGFPESSGWQEIPEGFTVEIEPEGVVRAEAMRIHRNYIRIRVRALSPGSADLRIRANDSGYAPGFLFDVGKGLFISADRIAFGGMQVLLFTAGLFLAAVSAIFLNYFVRLKGPALYSYLSIFSAGFAIFTGTAAISVLSAAVCNVINPYRFSALSSLRSIADTAVTSMLYTAVPMFLFSAAMIISNIELLRHERFRFANILGIVIPFILLLGMLLPFLLGLRGFSGSFRQYLVRETVENVYATVYMYFECMLAGSVICGLRAARRNAAYDKDYIIILGCRFRKDGSLTPLLQGRCDRAIRFCREQQEASGKEAVLIPSGGRGADESMPEAEAMARYLVSQGIPESRIIREDQSRNTYENMAFSKKIIDGANPEGKAVFSTTNYHVFRSGLWASLAGLPAEGIGSRTKWWFWPNAFMRECVGLMANRIRTEILLLVITAAVNILLSFLTIR